MFSHLGSPKEQFGTHEKLSSVWWKEGELAGPGYVALNVTYNS